MNSLKNDDQIEVPLAEADVPIPVPSGGIGNSGGNFTANYRAIIKRALLVNGSLPDNLTNEFIDQV